MAENAAPTGNRTLLRGYRAASAALAEEGIAIAPGTLAGKVCRGIGPPLVRLSVDGTSVYFRRAELVAWTRVPRAGRSAVHGNWGRASEVKAERYRARLAAEAAVSDFI